MSTRIDVLRPTRPSAILAALALPLAILPPPLASARPEPHAARAAEPALAADRQQASDTYGRLPMAFEPKLGQTDEQVRYLARGRG